MIGCVPFHSGATMGLRTRLDGMGMSGLWVFLYHQVGDIYIVIIFERSRNFSRIVQTLGDMILSYIFYFRYAIASFLYLEIKYYIGFQIIEVILKWVRFFTRHSESIQLFSVLSSSCSSPLQQSKRITWEWSTNYLAASFSFFISSV